MACANFQFRAAITGRVTSGGQKAQITSEKTRTKRLNRNFVWSPLWGGGLELSWEIGQQETNYRLCCLPQIQLRVQPRLSFPTSSPAPCLITILPLLSSLNLSDYSHKYTGTTTIYNHPLVSPCLFLTKPQAAHLFNSYLLPLWVDFAFYLPMNVNKRGKGVDFI